MQSPRNPFRDGKRFHGAKLYNTSKSQGIDFVHYLFYNYTN